MNYYEVLGVPPNATQDDVHHAYLAKAEQLTPERFAAASEEVRTAVSRASVAIDAAWHVLSDVALRAHYDSDVTLSGSGADNERDERSSWRRRHAEHVWDMERGLGLSLTSVLGVHPSSRVATSQDEYPKGLADQAIAPDEEWLASPLYDPYASLERIADFFVPSVCGIRGSEVWYAVARADLHIKCVWLTDHPSGDGIVVTQDPLAGTTARRFSTLTIEIALGEESSAV